jgi:hypothetical protein
MSWHRLSRLPSTARESLAVVMAAVGSLPDPVAAALLAAARHVFTSGLPAGSPTRRTRS